MTIYDPESELYLFEDKDFYGDEQFDGIQSVSADVPDDVLERLVSYDISHRKIYNGMPYCNFFYLEKDRANKLIDMKLKEMGLTRQELGYKD